MKYSETVKVGNHRHLAFGAFALACVLMLTTLMASPVMAATIYVNTDLDDSEGGIKCTLREAIQNANADITTDMACSPGSGADEIVFAEGVGYTLTLSGQLPAITSEISISGLGAETTIIQANADPDTATYRVFEVTAAGNLTLNDLTVQNGKCAGSCSGNATSGGGILNGGNLTLNRVYVLDNRSSMAGGGILSTGTLTLNDSQISDNQATGYDGGGIYNYTGSMNINQSTIANNSGRYGGGIENYGTVEISDSSIIGNLSDQDGGAMYNWGSVTITGSTIADNTANDDGGAFSNGNYLSLSNTTITGNVALGLVHNVGGGAIDQWADGTSPELHLTNVTLADNSHDSAGGDGIGITAGIVFTANSIIAGNGTENCSGGPILSSGNNIEDSNTCMFGEGDLVDTDPLLDILADNGGATRTMALLPGSPAINAAANWSCPSTDQRGEARPYEVTCDIGAYEYQGQGGPDFVVNTAADTDDGVCSVEDCSLREAINAANDRPGADTISFADAYTITLDGSQLPVIESELTITGKGAANTILQASTCDPMNGGCTPADYRVLEVSDNGNLTLDGVTVRYGYVNNSGGGILSSGVLDMLNSVVANNVAEVYGSAIYSKATATLSVTDSTITGNSTVGSGAVASQGNGNILRSTFSDNSSGIGGGIYSEDTLLVSNSTFDSNSADTGGGAIHNRGVATITNSTFAYNSAVYLGRAIQVWNGSISLYNNIMAYNTGGGNTCHATPSASVNNLIDDGSCDASLTGDPQLEPLGNNGGSTLTFAISESSPAFDAGDDATCTTTDQRSISRSQGIHCDIGSYEFDQIDSDGDGVPDNSDNCPAVANADQLNTDGDTPGDACDSDDDDDGVDDSSDAFPLDASESADTDGDGIGNNADTDDDGDTLSDEDEVANGTDPLLADTDDDGVNDNLDAYPLDASRSAVSSSESSSGGGGGGGGGATNPLALLLMLFGLGLIRWRKS